MQSNAPYISDHSKAVYVYPNPLFPNLRQIHTVPPVYVIEDFLTREEADHLIECGKPGLKRSIVVDANDGKISDPSRTSESCFLLKSDHVWLSSKIEALVGKPAITHEPPQVARYLSSQFYLPHFDAFDLNSVPGRECAKTGGQRVATVLIYLNDVPSGGGTYFPKMDLRVLPRKGMALLFFPSSVNGDLDPLALHSAEPAVDEKWVCQVWVRQREFA